MIHEYLGFVKMVEQSIYETQFILPKSWRTNFIEKSGSLHLELVVNSELFELELIERNVHRKESLEAFKHSGDKGVVIVTDKLSPFLRDYCDEFNINFIDRAGNARIAYQSLFLYIEGRKLLASTTFTSSMTIGMVKCIFAFLNDEPLLNATYSEISVKAGLSMGMVSKTIKYLLKMHFLREKNGKYQFTDKQTLIYEWLLGYKQRLAPKLQVWRLPPPKRWELINQPSNSLWFGEVAATQRGFMNHPQTLKLFAFDKPKGYAIGNPELPKLQVVAPFWNHELEINEKGQILLTIADLLTDEDGRLKEIAEEMNERYLHLKKLP
ncbi:MAG: hypothetical protein CO158_04105 [Piscirickettsiaceae bacterium CG_4_9_14_3_um_filter_43_564]|nr:hypothetical protein [Thiomicrospira sp.]OIP95892.1 MAG: hypothetical protein AUK56_03860 [Thiomicrospira sp. CG2_30_44_34]PIQ05333.1 MAG: hypothetical protein COW74_02780 [Piscirickettsiaceae bacterium CG18_big_fil_WC_8_21_14_2_50_44_103]PIU39146.1 MAG: hypothetical protein COT01_02965 [Piscirickettsiaceae bacterium CG07_land_8_20_14_0_80_44_28]PIW58696.1 MAG: hypothetical protein COW14_00240 [Piscirickettsiaceae bacterium CG12_big_fil_rev_8_21_14_0_65_44_934]PIW78064.1 MAG: hypothetical p